MPHRPSIQLAAAILLLMRLDTRAPDRRNQFQVAHGQKRTTVEDVTASPVGGAAPAPATKDIVQAQPADAGTTVTAAAALVNAIATTDFDFAQVIQGLLSDCWLLAAIMCAAQADPRFFRNIIYLDPSDPTRVIVQLVWSGVIVRVHTSLQVSTSYVQGGPGNVSSLIVELLEKVAGLVRSGLNTYAADAWGSVGQALSLFGFVFSPLAVTPAAVAAALAAGKVVGIDTTSALLNKATTGPWWHASHCETATSIDTAKSIVYVRNPWAGGDILAIPFAEYTTNAIAGVDAGSLPSPLILQAPAPVAPTPPVIAGPTVPTGGTLTGAGTLTPTAMKLYYSPATSGGYADASVLWIGPLQSTTIPLSGTNVLTVSITAGGAFTVNGQRVAVGAGGVGTVTVTGPAKFTVNADNSGYNLTLVHYTPSAAPATPPAPTITAISATVTLSSGAPMTFAPTSIVVTGKTLTIGGIL